MNERERIRVLNAQIDALRVENAELRQELAQRENAELKRQLEELSGEPSPDQTP